MPDHIEREDIDRMFPFAFYDELSDHLSDYVLLNPAFIKQPFESVGITMSDDERRKLYESTKERKRDEDKRLSENNIIEVEPVNEVLILEPCCHKDHISDMLYDSKNRSQIALSVLVVQLYDSHDKPVFSKDVTHKSIQNIPEVLWDDPNLLIGVVTFKQDEAEIAVLKIPERIEKKMLENTNESSDT